MEIRIIQLEQNPTVSLAAEELKRYLPKIDPCVQTAILFGDESFEGIKVGVHCKEAEESGIKPSDVDDEILIRVNGGTGVITGSNPRSVLIAAYRLLREAGCRFLRPGRSGEKITQKDLQTLNVSIHEKAAYRHRGVCIEGNCSYDHVLQMIEWMPKIGLNAYFYQFFVPYTFFEKWYNHNTNPYMQPQPVSVDEVAAMKAALTAPLKQRGLLLHDVGHGWTCEPFGISGHGWDPQEYHLTEEQAAPFALVNGKRGVWHGIGLNTNLCYSNPLVQQAVVDAIVSYAKEHPQVDYLHFWLADESRNQCECDGCKNTLPADFYVQMLNKVDKRLTEEKIGTRIVFLVYLDLLWAPEQERIINTDRFALMFAPISRTYSKTFLEAAESGTGKTVPYDRNNNTMPTKVEDNLAYVQKWQQQFIGDSFDYDYHMLWDWNFDLGGYRSAEVLFHDMKDLHRFGINGMMSCQMQRVFFPTALGMIGMAEALWNGDASFDETVDGYFADLFGEDAKDMKDYFKQLSEQFHPAYLRLEEKIVDPERAAGYKKLADYIRSKQPWFHEKSNNAESECDRTTWNIIVHHAEICLMMANVLERRASGDQEGAVKLWEQLRDRANRLEATDSDIQNAWDTGYFLNVAGGSVNGEQRPGVEY